MTEEIIVFQSIYAFGVLWFVLGYLPDDLEDRDAEERRNTKTIILVMNAFVTLGTAIRVFWGWYLYKKQIQTLKLAFSFIAGDRDMLTVASEKYFNDMSARIKKLSNRDERWKNYLKDSNFNELEPILGKEGGEGEGTKAEKAVKKAEKEEKKAEKEEKKAVEEKEEEKVA
eukprot:CAMPEP_0114523194 /NCGR_PEP_ID=MMETSP0109-20121206/21161_1 /TAXON_ID=29199 /ORGANISM="Chlorarachnion reptans, Strain CCCM449" /LENGTH=170 /DNA_ID=CAMNT_0001704493 /DNA_START=240 /DNA_END=752 /DNA_ORIENTATION=+